MFNVDAEVKPTNAELLKGEIRRLHEALLATGCPEECLIPQAAEALAKISGSSQVEAELVWVHGMVEEGQIPTHRRWPWNPKKVRLQEVARRMILDFYDH